MKYIYVFLFLMFPSIALSQELLPPNSPASKAEVEAAIKGRNLLTGVGDPSALEGLNGDVFIDLSNGNLFRKEDGVWVYKGALWFDTDPRP